MPLINKKELKKRFERQKIKIGKVAVDRFILVQDKKITNDIQLLKRKASLSGRKIIREKDFDED